VPLAELTWLASVPGIIVATTRETHSEGLRSALEQPAHVEVVSAKMEANSVEVMSMLVARHAEVPLGIDSISSRLSKSWVAKPSGKFAP